VSVDLGEHDPAVTAAVAATVEPRHERPPPVAPGPVVELLGGSVVLGALILVIALGAQSFSADKTDEFGAVLQAIVTAFCGLAVVALRPRSTGEISYARGEEDALVRQLITHQLEQAASG
jgi:hypothetical protein